MTADIQAAKACILQIADEWVRRGFTKEENIGIAIAAAISVTIKEVTKSADHLLTKEARAEYRETLEDALREILIEFAKETT